ncbi:hypothetical protein BJV82DRAFT_589810 [Fennellomyces sp. T-0311]|nr:hypothetical protein BJV82DRAFT_589810 [Fennellomyces sp. T-0311]
MPTSKQGRLPSGSNPASAAVSRSVVFKLIFFTLAMFIVPIATYYYTVDGVFDGNGTFAAGAAAGMANLVAICYIIAAVLEDKDKDKDKQE